MTMLCWIKKERVWKQQVGQRVDKIRRLTPKDLWRHCPGEINPTNLPSCGLTTKELSTSNTWWNGLSFLHNPINRWPEMSQPAQAKEEEIQQEAIKTEKVITHSTLEPANHLTVELTR